MLYDHIENIIQFPTWMFVKQDIFHLLTTSLYITKNFFVFLYTNEYLN